MAMIDALLVWFILFVVAYFGICGAEFALNWLIERLRRQFRA